MRDGTMPIQRPAVASSGARSGQAIVIFALAIAGLIGMVGLAVGVAHAYERRQFLQGAAHNAALTGSYELNFDLNPNQTVQNVDAAVVQRMVATLRQSGISVRNYNASNNTLTQLANWTACQAPSPLSTTDAYLQAFYIPNSGPPSYIPSSGAASPVGTGNLPAGLVLGQVTIQVQRLATCVPGFFTSVLGHGNIDVDVGASADVGASVAQSDIAMPSPGTNAAFYIYGDRSTTPSLYGVNGLPTIPGNGNGGEPFKVQCSTTYWLPVSIASLCPTAGNNNNPGDLVTVHTLSNAGSRNADSWQSVQYTDGSVSNQNPQGITVWDGSNRGCLLSPNGLIATNVTIGNWYYDHGGSGASHCAAPPSAGQTISVAVVDKVCKNGGVCQDPTLPSAPQCSRLTGGYCVRVAGVVYVYVVTTNGSSQHNKSGPDVMGYIVGIDQDPCGIVEMATSYNRPPNKPGVSCPSYP